MSGSRLTDIGLLVRRRPLVLAVMCQKLDLTVNFYRRVSYGTQVFIAHFLVFIRQFLSGMDYKSFLHAQCAFTTVIA